MIRIFFARPGAGKTTLCCANAKKLRKKFDHVYLTFPNTVPNVHYCDFKALGEWSFPRNSHVSDDESGISFNSRKTLSVPQCLIAYLKLARHYGVSFDFYSQSHEDMDVTIRRLADEYWYLYRIGPWTLGRRIYKRVGIDKNTHQIIDEYRFASMLWLIFWPFQLGWPFDKKFTLTFRPFYYKYFDSWDCDDLPVRDFPVLNPKKKKERKKRS